MTGRERLNALFRRQPVDRIPWTTLVDGHTLGIAPEHLRGRWGLDFYAALGCDVLLLDGWGTPHAFASPRLTWGPGVTDTTRHEGTRAVRELATPDGPLTAVFERHHPVKFPVTTLAELRRYRALWEAATYTPADDTATHAALTAAIGDAGIVTRFWGPSTVPHLLEYACGMEQFYYLLADHRADMEGLMAAMHRAELAAFDALAAGPCDVVILCENTSSYYISPDVYARYNGPHVADFVNRMHAAGKVAIVHMCGHIRNLLHLIRTTGLDGSHALTPPPTGDTPWELALDVLGEDHVIVGALDPTIFAAGPVADIGPALDRLYTPRLRRAHFLLGPFADGIPVPFERFAAIRDWLARQPPP